MIPLLVFAWHITINHLYITAIDNSAYMKWYLIHMIGAIIMHPNLKLPFGCLVLPNDVFIWAQGILLTVNVKLTITGRLLVTEPNPFPRR